MCWLKYWSCGQQSHEGPDLKDRVHLLTNTGSCSSSHDANSCDVLMAVLFCLDLEPPQDTWVSARPRETKHLFQFSGEIRESREGAEAGSCSTRLEEDEQDEEQMM